jgi:hypothetical protein
MTSVTVRLRVDTSPLTRATDDLQASLADIPADDTETLRKICDDISELGDDLTFVEVFGNCGEGDQFATMIIKPSTALEKILADAKATALALKARR